jgi:hypothetical protein
MDRNAKITAARITEMPKSMFDPMPKVTVTFEDDTTKELFEFYPDELSFQAHEFVGLTEREAHDLFTKRDLAYIRR